MSDRFSTVYVENLSDFTRRIIIEKSKGRNRYAKKAENSV